MYCISCGKEMAEATAYCEFCGAPQQQSGGAANNNQAYTQYSYNQYGAADGQQGYAGPGAYAPYPPVDENDKPMTLGAWMKTLLIMSIPLVNLVMIFVWAFGNGNTSRRNYFRAMLLYTLIVYALVFVLVLFTGIGAGLGSTTQLLGV